MKNTMTITKKVSRHLQLNGFTKEELIFMVKDELLKFYTDKLTDLDSFSALQKEELINILQSLAKGKYNKLISDKIPNNFLFDEVYNAKVSIEDDLEGCGNLEITINLIPSWIENLAI